VDRTDVGARISVALCTHNGELYIVEQLESILAQSLAPIEIILSDDASTDRTIELARGVLGARPDVALTVLHNPTPLGVSANFEQAALACSGELIALSDQDDAWHPDKLESIERVFAQRPDVALVHTDAQLVNEDRTPIGHSLLESLEVRASELQEIHSGHSFTTLVRRNLVTGATAVFRSSLLKSAAPFPELWVHDEWLGVIAAATATTELIEQELIDYRQHETNQIGARKLSFVEKLRKLREPRQERNENLVARARILTDRLELLGPAIAPARLRLARGKLAHERSRLALPSPRFLRVWPVLGAALSGRYRCYSLGLRDVVRDIAQPAH
jgi:glycosyltransferase involved in cell wall biosynthesis